MDIKDFCLQIRNLFGQNQDFLIARLRGSYCLRLIRCVSAYHDHVVALRSAFPKSVSIVERSFYDDGFDIHEPELCFRFELSYPVDLEDVWWFHTSIYLSVCLHKDNSVIFHIQVDSFDEYKDVEEEQLLEKFPMLDPVRSRSYLEAVEDLILYTQQV